MSYMGSKNLHYVTDHEHDSLKVNVWCALKKNKVTGLLLFGESMVTGDTFLAMVENCFVLCPSGNSLPVRWCTTSLLLLCSRLPWAFLDTELVP
jgi:hypothetical protein